MRVEISCSNGTKSIVTEMQIDNWFEENLNDLTEQGYTITQMAFFKRGQSEPYIVTEVV